MPWRGKGFRAIALPRFHTYSVIWLPEEIEYFVDGVSYLKASPATIPAGTVWVFRKPFFLLLNAETSTPAGSNPVEELRVSP